MTVEDARVLLPATPKRKTAAPVAGHRQITGVWRWHITRARADSFVQSPWVFFQLLSWVAIRSRIG